MSHEDTIPPVEEAPSVLETTFEHPAPLAEALAESVAEDLRAAVAARGQASLVVAGGQTPELFFEALSRQLVPWSQVIVTLTDERWVPKSDPQSNERLVRSKLLQGDAEEARLVSLKTEAASADAGAAEVESRLEEIARPFDVVILGMGEDGHIASLFPHDPALAPASGRDRRLAVAVARPDGPARISLSLRALLDSRRIILHFTGDKKWHTYRLALGRGPLAELPVRAILGRGREPIDVYWSP
jgi:6-phosphogluconolactonase